MYVEQPGDDLIVLAATAMLIVVVCQAIWGGLMDRINWNRTGANQYTTAQAHGRKGYTAVINFTTAYELTITGDGAPSPTTHPTRKTAKNAFRKFLLVNRG